MNKVTAALVVAALSLGVGWLGARTCPMCDQIPVFGEVTFTDTHYAAINLDGDSQYAQRQRAQKELLRRLRGPEWWPIPTGF